jgi:2-polyprenyl-6-methoxyphenol hydroxylase-like FAD-dependent oxidoreductase
MSQQHVEVVGAGIVGLGIASLLADTGWSVRVHERDPEIREVGAAIAMRGGGLTILKQLGAVELLEGKTEHLPRVDRLNGQGKVLQSAPIDFFSPVRQDLVNALRDIALGKGVEIRTGSKVESAHSDGSVVLADGDALQADLVIAADGFNSRLRSGLGLERTAKLLKSGSARILMPSEDEPLIWQEWWSGKLRIGIAPPNRELTYVFMNSPESDTRASSLPISADYWSAAFPGLKRRFFDRLEASEAVRHRYPLVYCHSWVAGRVALVGDSAHALPATLGLGASLGLVNAQCLVQGLRTASVESALTRWDKTYRPATVRTQKVAVAYAEVTRLCPPWLEGARSKAFQLLNAPWAHKWIMRDHVLKPTEA